MSHNNVVRRTDSGREDRRLARPTLLRNVIQTVGVTERRYDVPF